MKLVDANIILRFLLNDHPEMSAKAKEILLNDPVLLLTQVIAEVIYVLRGVYGVERPEIAAALGKIMELENVQLDNSEIVSLAIEEYAISKLDFVDLLLLAHHQITGLIVETFDKALLQRLHAAGMPEG